MVEKQLNETSVNPKSNFFLKKDECWKCNHFFHRLVLTKYDGILCKHCYTERHIEIKTLFIKVFNFFETEFYSSLEDFTNTIEDMVEYIYENYDKKSYIYSGKLSRIFKT